MAVTRVAVGEELWAARPWWRKACPGKNPVEIRCRLFSRVCSINGKSRDRDSVTAPPTAAARTSVMTV